jgi:DNA polymerase-3 subunit epsilon
LQPAGRRRGAAPRPYVAALVASAEGRDRRPGPLPAASAEETECILRWLETAGTRLVELAGEWSSPAYGAAGHVARFAQATVARGAARPLDDRRGLRPVARPLAAVQR